MRVCVCLKIMTAKGKQNYVRCITERAREFMEKRERERAGERKGEGSSRIKWKVKKKKGEWNPMDIYVCWKKKKGNIWMKEWQRIKNHNLKILPQYFHNKF